MRTTLIILIIIFNITVNANAVNLNNSYVISEEEKIYYQWRNDFYWSLVKGESLKLKVAGLILLYTYSYDKRHELKPDLDLILKQNLSKEMYYYLRSVCDKYSPIKQVCEDNDFYNKLIASDSGNINLYIMDLDSANYNKNHEKAAQLLSRIKKTTFAKTYTGFAAKELKAELIKFTNSYPIPPQDLQTELKNSEINLFAEEEKNVLINNETLTLYSSRSNYSNFANNCQSKETKAICTHVIDILMNHSDLLDQDAAYRIQEDIAILNQDYTVFKKLIIKNMRQRIESSCKNRLTSGSTHNKEVFYTYAKLHPLYSNTIIQNLSKYSYEAYEIAAKKLEKYLIKNNLVDPIVSNVCKEITKLSDDEVFERYQDDRRFNYNINRYDKEVIKKSD